MPARATHRTSRLTVPRPVCVWLTPRSPVYHVAPTGWVKLSMDNVGDLHYVYQAGKR